MSAQEEVNLLLTASDEASGTLAEASNKIDGSLSEIDRSAESAGNSISSGMAKGEEAAKKNTVGLKDTAMASANLATAGVALYGIVDKLNSAHIAADRANLQVTKSQMAFTDAQNNAKKASEDLEKANLALNLAIEQDGENSAAAEKARQKVTDATEKYKAAVDKVPVAEETLRLSQEKLGNAQENINKTMITSGISVIPTVITAVGSLNTLMSATPAIQGAVTTATGALSGAMSFLAANPIVIVVAGLAALAIGLYYAYENCQPIHDAIDTLGRLLAGAFSAAVSTVYNGLKWLWDNVLVPLGSFLGGVFTATWNALGTAVQWVYNNYFKPLFDGISLAWNNILVPLGIFLKDTLVAAWNALGSAIEWVYNTFIKPVFDALQFAWDTILKPISDFLNSVSSGFGAVSDAIGGALGLNKPATVSTSTVATVTAKVPKLAEGGVVNEPTLAIVGEGGVPEKITPLDKDDGGGVTQFVFNAPLLHIEGSVDRVTADYAVQRMKDELQNIVIVNGSSTSRVRFQSQGNLVTTTTL